MTFIKKIVPYLLTLLIVLIIIECSLLCNNPEIIFPSMLTLIIGLWLAPKQIWKISPVKLIGLMLIYSLLGIVMVRYIEVPLYLKLVASFFMCSVGILMSHTTFSPLISVCLIPIFLETESWLYPLSVTLVTFFMIIVQSFLQHYHYQEYTLYRPVKVHFKKDTIIFIERLIIVAVITAIACYFNCHFLIAPPVIVAFMDMSDSHFASQHQLPYIYILTVIFAFIGAYSRYFLMTKWDWPLLWTVLLVTLILLIILAMTHLFFPPIGAITLLPFLIDPELLLIYPVLIAGGFLILMILAYLISLQQKSLSL